MNIKKVIIFATEPFPNGMAATNRIISYSKGFLHNGKETEVICLRRTENRDNNRNPLASGSFEGIKYSYLSKSTFKSKYFLFRRLDNFISLLFLILIGFKKIKSSTLSIYYSSDNTPLYFLYFINKLRGGLLFKEESEHPDVYLRNKNNIGRFFFNNFHYNLFDGHLLMTKNLLSFFSSKYKIPSFHSPMTIDLDRFNLNSKKNENNFSIIYTGLLDNKKDGVDILLKAFAGAFKKHNSIRLVIYGPAGADMELHNYYNLVENLGISNYVFFKGSVTREVITNKILEAKLLVLPRPNSLQAQHGFPTKLGEYLATGNPTLVTAVGEIPNYLTDGKNSFIAIPGDIESLENKLLEIIENYPRAREVGLAGRKIAEEYFNNLVITNRIITFAESI